MKKRKKVLEVVHASAMSNGIKFYSQRQKGYMAVSTVDENEKIKVQWCNKREYIKEKKLADKMYDIKEMLFYTLCLMPICILFANVWEWFMRNHNAKDGACFFLVWFPITLLLGFFDGYFVRRKKERNFFKYHAAEHMACNAYKALQRVPTINEIREYSRFNYSCGTNITTEIIIIFPLMSLAAKIYYFYNWPPIALVIMTGVITISYLVLERYGYLNFLQYFTTEKPDEIELRVAIEGLKMWEEKEKIDFPPSSPNEFS